MCMSPQQEVCVLGGGGGGGKGGVFLKEVDLI